MWNTACKRMILIGVALFAALAVGDARGETEEHVGVAPYWCAARGSVEISWEFDSGAPLYTVTVAGRAIETDEERLPLACADLRAWVIDGLLLRHVWFELLVRVDDANGAGTVAGLDIFLLAAAPQTEMSEIDLVVGYTDLFVWPKPWPFWSPDGPGNPPVVAIFRYRAVGATEWIYEMPFPPPSESGGDYKTPSHVSGLKPGTEYELQAAWLWDIGAPPGRDPRWGWSWFDSDVFQEDLWKPADSWWRDSNDPRAIRWSETQRFALPLAEISAVEATHNEIRVSWPSYRGMAGLRFVTLQSEDWPGVIWADGGIRYTDSEQGPGSHRLATAVFSELPPNSTFDVTVASVLPWAFAPAPLMTARTRTLPAPADLPPGQADPGGYEIDVGVHDIRVRIHGEDAKYQNVELQPLTDGDVGKEHLRSYRAPDGTRDLSDGGVEFVFTDLPRGSTWRLYVNLVPFLEEPLPFVCAIRDIQLASRYPHEWFDWYLYSPVQGGRAIVSPGQIPAGAGAAFPSVPGCTLTHPMGE